MRRLVTISHELAGITPKLTNLSKDNNALKEELHDLSSQIANLPLPQIAPPNQHLSTLQSAIRDLSHCVTAPAAPLPQAPAPTPQPLPPARPLPTRKGKESAQARPPPPPPTLNDDPNYLIPYYDTKLGKAIGDPDRYSQLIPQSYVAGEF